MCSWMGDNAVFRAYFKGREKRPAEKVKDQKGRTFEECLGFDSFGAILNDDFIDISFDSKEMFDAFLNMAEKNQWRCLALPSPHGGHTYWRNHRKRINKSGHDIRLAVGLTADIHKGGTYIPLRVIGEDRFPPEYELLPNEVYQEVPEELLPLPCNVELWQLDEGSGRNEEMFRYILKLQDNITKDVEVLRRIMNNINDFILATPVDMDEFDTITRDEAFSRPNFWKGDGQYDFETAAHYLVDTTHAVMIEDNIHVYNGGIYVPYVRGIEKIMIEKIGGLRKSQRKETLEFMSLIADSVEVTSHPYIVFNNGVLDITTMELKPYTPDIVLRNKIPWNYNPDAYSEIMDNVLNQLSCGDAQIRSLLEECAGYCMYSQNDFHKAFMFLGEKANGKSTYIDAIRAMLGDVNTSALDICSMGDRFSTVLLHGKLANLGDDISDEFLSGNVVATFKKIVTGETIKAEHKGLDAFSFRPYAKLIFSANDIPRMRDGSGAVLRRLVIIPFKAKFTKDNPQYDPHIKHKIRLQEQQEYLVKIAVEGLKRVFENEGFTESDAVEAELHSYHKVNDSVYAFYDAVDIESIRDHSTSDVYIAYHTFCLEQGLSPVGKPNFVRRLCEKSGLSTKESNVNGKLYTIYI